MYLGCIDKSPRVEQAEAVLVAVMKTGSVHPPVSAGITLLNTHTHFTQTGGVRPGPASLVTNQTLQQSYDRVLGDNVG